MGSPLLPLFLLETPQDVLQPALIEADHHLTEGRDDGNAPSARDLHHLVEGFTISCNVEILVRDPLLRKILLRHPAIGSGRARVDFHLFFSHGIPPLYPRSYLFNLRKTNNPCQGTTMRSLKNSLIAAQACSVSEKTLVPSLQCFALCCPNSPSLPKSPEISGKVALHCSTIFFRPFQRLRYFQLRTGFTATPAA